jgi:glucosamine--fructose-6-phosphate aminotransferase (isomerizing)
VGPNTLFIAVSQSGETADTLAALREAKARGARTLAMCNVIDSSIARDRTTSSTPRRARDRVASTKAFMTQMLALQLLAVWLGERRGTMPFEAIRRRSRRWWSCPASSRSSWFAEQVEALAPQVPPRARLFVSRAAASTSPIALEGALKLKEISYIHAEGYAAGEMKHGPIALIDEAMPVVVLSPWGPTTTRPSPTCRRCARGSGRSSPRHRGRPRPSTASPTTSSSVPDGASRRCSRS